MTIRLAQTAMVGWAELDGYAVAHNMPDIRTLPLDRFCNFVWFLMMRNADQQQQQKAKARLWQPPPNNTQPIPKKSPWSAENETNALAAFKMGMGTARSQ